MESVKKFGLWIVAGVIILAAIGFYFVLIRSRGAKRAETMKTLEKRRDNLNTWTKKKIPNPTWINNAAKYSEHLTEQLNDVESFLREQPRRSHTRRFFENDIFGQETEIEEAMAWRSTYRTRNEELQKQLLDAGITTFTVQTLENVWGTRPPQPAQIAVAMELYWFQKDLADFLTGQVEKDFASLIAIMSGQPGAFPTTPSDLVINRNPTSLNELLRGLDSEVLVNLFTAIIFNDQQQDLAMIFNTHLPEVLPWERPAESNQASVLALTMDAEQQAFLDQVLPPGKPDVSNRGRFIDFVMELRTVRYRQDVIDLLDANFPEVAMSLRRGTPEERARLLSDIRSWNRTKVAQAIDAVVSVNNTNDYKMLVENHAPKILQILGVGISQASAARLGTGRGGGLGGGMGGGMGGGLGGLPGGMGDMPTAPGTDPAIAAAEFTSLYKMSDFDLNFIIEFENLPVCIRRLLVSSWRYRVAIQQVVPVPQLAGATASGTGGGGPTGLGGGAGFGGLSMPGAGGFNRPGVGGMRPPTAVSPQNEIVVETRNLVNVRLRGVGYQFNPLTPPSNGSAAIGTP